jgi:hypothetical protein
MTQAHTYVYVVPRMLDVEDANNLKVPLGIFPSKDEPLDEVSCTDQFFQQVS